ncbi:protein PALS2 isoform X2 [Schistocerca nitens]|uniref:protein PALS2 isoform X2 n=1 Tax=Schistocerca nitens TaxID=7011 RepID=UPI002119681C|nr:protein PALS2 isoform X2 [Schistocerca nitens]
MVLFGRTENVERRELLASMEQMGLGKPIDNAAFQHVRDNIEELNGRVGANDTDLIFLKGLMDSPVMRSLVKVQDRLEDPETPAQPVSTSGLKLATDVAKNCESSRSRDAQELSNILKSAHFKALLESHDTVAEKSFEKPEVESQPQTIEFPASEMTADTIRMVGLRKSPKEPLGLTVQVDESGNLVIARILAGGMIDRQGLLHVGDVILEVNGVPVSTPEELQHQISQSDESVTLKIGPGFEDIHSQLNSGQVKSQRLRKDPGNGGYSFVCYMRALFNYSPDDDSLLPCKEIGLAFKHGDILQVLNQKDPNWWQAKLVGSNGPAGLIPSQELEERRKAFVKPEADYVHKIGICGARVSKKKRKTMYQSKSNCEFDKAELLLYEEVTRMPPFKRRTLALIGSQGVGRRTLKNRLINSDPEKFGGVVPHTSRPPRVLEENGKGYWFIDRESMEEDIREHRFLEYGEHNGHLYGTKLDSIRDVIRQGKMCILDCSPAALKILHNSSEFMPYVIFIAAPGMEQLKHLYGMGRTIGSSKSLTFDRASSIRYSSRRARTLESLASLYEEEDLRQTLEESARLQRTYEKYIDLTIINEDFDGTFRKVIEALEVLSTEHQWVPVNWVY